MIGIRSMVMAAPFSVNKKFPSTALVSLCHIFGLGWLFNYNNNNYDEIKYTHFSSHLSSITCVTHTVISTKKHRSGKKQSKTEG